MKRKTIAVLMASIDREYQTDFIRGVMDTAEELNIDVCVFNCMGYMNVDVATSDRGESAVFDLAGARDFDGIISLRATLAGESSVRKVEKLLHRMAGLPHVSIDVPTNGAVSIQFDDAVSVRQEVEIAAGRHAVDVVESVVNVLDDEVCILHDLFHNDQFHKKNEDILPL